MVRSFLLIGQSNAAGRGFPSEVEPIVNPDVVVLRNGRWRPMYVPVNPDRATSGINFTESFADLYQKDHGVKVGIIPCADGGSQLDDWAVGGQFFDNACYQAELASRTSDIVGILWHQGESDCYDNCYPVYEEKLTVILTTLRERLGLQEVPVLLGGLGDFLPKYERNPALKNYPFVNEAIKRVSKRLHRAAFVSAEGLDSNPDFLHFSARALREFGVRYYKEFVKLENPDLTYSAKDWQKDNEFTLL